MVPVMEDVTQDGMDRSVVKSIQSIVSMAVCSFEMEVVRTARLRGMETFATRGVALIVDLAVITYMCTVIK